MDDEMTQDQTMKLVDAYVQACVDLECENSIYGAVDSSSVRHTDDARNAVVAAIDALTKDAERMRWLDKNTTFFNVDHTEPVRGANIPILSSVSARIWYHATDDTESYPLSAVVDAAMKEQI